MSDSQRLPHVEGLVSSEIANTIQAPQSSFGNAEAQGLLGVIMEQSPLLMSFMDVQFRYVMASRAVLDYLQLTQDQVIGSSIFTNRPGVERILRPALQKVIETGQPYSAQEVPVPNSSREPENDQELFWNVSYTPVRDTSGKISGVLSIVEDVTERVVQRQRLERIAIQEKQKAAQLEVILSNLSEGIGVIDAEGNIILANPMLDQILGRSMLGQNPYRDGSQALGRRQLDGTPLDNKDTISGRVLKGEFVRDYRFLLKDSQGRDHFLAGNGTPIFDETGRVTGGVLLFHDVTEQESQHRELEEAIQATEESQTALLEVSEAVAGITELEELLDRIVEIVPQVTGCDRVGISLYDPATEMTSQAAVYGLPPEQKAEWKAMPPAQRDRTSPYDEIFFEQHQSLVVDMENLIEEARKQGQELPNPYGVKTMFATPLVYKGEVLGMLSLDHSGRTHNFSPREIRVLEGIARLAAIAIQNVQLLTEANQATTLREANRLKDEFLSLVAHELRNPLTAVQGYTQMTQRRLRKAGIPEADLRPLETIIGQAQRMTRLVEDLLDLSRIETGRLELRHEECDLAGRVNQLIETYQADTGKHRLTLELVSGPDHSLYTGRWDGDRLEQVISNLIGNAIKYSPEGGPVNIQLQRQSLSASGARDRNSEALVVHFSIQDRGIGIPVDQQAALFERFYRANNSRDSGLPGLGLGLYISSQIIRLHGGQMWAESAGEGLGSTFHFVLPLD